MSHYICDTIKVSGWVWHSFVWWSHSRQCTE